MKLFWSISDSRLFSSEQSVLPTVDTLIVTVGLAMKMSSYYITEDFEEILIRFEIVYTFLI